MLHIFSQIFSNHLFVVENWFLLSYIYLYKFNFCYSFSMFPCLFMIYRYCSSIMKASIISSIDMISCCCFCFLSNQENLYMIHHNSDLFYSISNTTNEYNQGQNHYLLLSPNWFNIYFWVNQKVLWQLYLLHH